MSQSSRITAMLPHDSSFFHLHLVSDSTGETLITVARAASAQYSSASPVEHVYPAVRTNKQLDRVLSEIASAPGLVLYTLLDQTLIGRLEDKCRDLGLPCLSVLGPVLRLFETYLGAAKSTYKVGAQHILNAEYFRRIDALNYTMMHDDGQFADVEDIEEADVVLLGVSRTSKTPTSIYLANRGVKTANIPLVLGMPVPARLESIRHPLVVGLFATPERIVQIRENRLLGLRVHLDHDQYVDRKAVAEEIAFSRRLCAKHGWPLIDVTRRSIEETAAAILALLAERRRSPAEG
jgi:regulator of PEP synthase PpsR (kinase-PPPase family)